MISHFSEAVRADVMNLAAIKPHKKLSSRPDSGLC